MKSGRSASPAVPRHSLVIVDDRPDIRELLSIRLGMVAGLEIIGVGADGSAAVDLARDLAPDLMVLDLAMPVMGGAEAIPILRATAPEMRIVVYSGDLDQADLTRGRKPDAAVSKGANLGDLVGIVQGLLAEGPRDIVTVTLGPLSLDTATVAFDSWVGLNARVREALETRGDQSADLLGDVAVDAADLLSLMGVFMQFGRELGAARMAGASEVDLRFMVRRDAGVAARRALLALGGNGTLRAFNQAWSHSPTREAERALDLVNNRLVDQLPAS